MKKSRRKFSKEFKLTALRHIWGGESVNEVARALEMDASDVRRWRRGSRGLTACLSLGVHSKCADQTATYRESLPYLLVVQRRPLRSK